MTNQEIVQQFCDLAAKRDTDLLRPLLADDVVYQNVGMAPVTGLENVIANLASQFEMFPDTYEFETISCVAEGDVVMNERLDKLSGPSGISLALPVMGTFIVRDGKITRWTDYWDSGLIAKMMAGEDCTALVPTY
jgi:limonene-1,2-epoxide hydrolase